MCKGSGHCAQRSSLATGRKVVYYRHGDQIESELESLQDHFATTDSLETLQPGDTVICRFAYLPFSDLLRQEVELRGAHLLQDHHEYEYLSKMNQWYADLKDLTPHTWFDITEVTGPGPWIVKGETNSRKDQWATHCYAENREALKQVIARLGNDPLLGNQALCIRKYIPLKAYGKHLETGIPLSDEYRFFVANQKIISGGYYWSEHLSMIENQGYYPSPHNVPETFLQEVIERIGNQAPYYALDVAQTQAGRWIVIELGDATMAGLAGNDPKAVYKGLSEILSLR